MDAVNGRDPAEELREKAARLTDGQRQEYERLVVVMEQFRDGASDRYRLDIVNTMLQGLSEKSRGRQLNDAAEREKGRPLLHHDGRGNSAKAAPGDQPASEKPDAALVAVDRPDPMARVYRRDATRDYSELRFAHAEVAAKQGGERAAVPEAATAILSVEKLQGMAERYAEARKASKLALTPSDQRKDAEQTRAHADDRARLDRAHGPQPTEPQKQERALLDHQQLAERVAGEAFRLGQHFRRQEAPGAETYEREGRSAIHTARLAHEQRQILGLRSDHSRNAARAVRQQEQQKQSAEQEAARGGASLTSEQRANASLDTKQTLDRREHAEANRKAGPEVGLRSAPKEASAPGHGRTGGRGR